MPAFASKTYQTQALASLEHFLSAAREKKAVGATWARASGGKALFLMAEKRVNGLDVSAQIRHALA